MTDYQTDDGMSIKDLEFWVESDHGRAERWRSQNPVEASTRKIELRKLRKQKEQDEALAEWQAKHDERQAERDAKQAQIDEKKRKRTQAAVKEGEERLEQDVDPIVREKRRRAARTF